MVISELCRGAQGVLLGVERARRRASQRQCIVGQMQGGTGPSAGDRRCSSGVRRELRQPKSLPRMRFVSWWAQASEPAGAPAAARQPSGRRGAPSLAESRDAPTFRDVRTLVQRQDHARQGHLRRRGCTVAAARSGGLHSRADQSMLSNSARSFAPRAGATASTHATRPCRCARKSLCPPRFWPPGP